MSIVELLRPVVGGPLGAHVVTGRVRPHEVLRGEQPRRLLVETLPSKQKKKRKKKEAKTTYFIVIQRNVFREKYRTKQRQKNHSPSSSNNTIITTSIATITIINNRQSPIVIAQQAMVETVLRCGSTLVLSRLATTIPPHYRSKHTLT